MKQFTSIDQTVKLIELGFEKPKSEWRDIEGYEGLYQISSNAEVRKVMPNGEYKTLKVSIGGSGYPKVSLRKNKISKTMLLHRLLALTFIPNPNNYPCINHKDENPLNCSLQNLE